MKSDLYCEHEEVYLWGRKPTGGVGVTVASSASRTPVTVLKGYQGYHCTFFRLDDVELTGIAEWVACPSPSSLCASCDELI